MCLSGPLIMTCHAIGLAPGCNESAGKRNQLRFQAGVYLKPCLVGVAHAAVKDKNYDYYADKFNKISKAR